ncbi:MAG: iron transporter, partial [Thermoplasmata archaeon]
KPGEIHAEVKLTDIKYSNTRVPYSKVTFTALNNDNGRKVSVELHQMWGGSGLHYGANIKLPGKGSYTMTVDVDVPTFARGLDKKDFLMTPIQTSFEYEFTEDIEIEEEEDIPLGEYLVKGLTSIVLPVLIIVVVVLAIFAALRRKEEGAVEEEETDKEDTIQEGTEESPPTGEEIKSQESPEEKE